MWAFLGATELSGVPIVREPVPLMKGFPCDMATPQRPHIQTLPGLRFLVCKYQWILFSVAIRLCVPPLGLVYLRSLPNEPQAVFSPFSFCLQVMELGGIEQLMIRLGKHLDRDFHQVRIDIGRGVTIYHPFCLCGPLHS